VARDDDVDFMSVKGLLHLLPKQPGEVRAVLPAAGAVQGAVAGGNDEGVAVAARLLQVAPQPRRLRGVDVGSVQRRLRVHLEKVHGAHAEAVVPAQGVTLG
jgi:hypothetical protein